MDIMSKGGLGVIWVSEIHNFLFTMKKRENPVSTRLSRSEIIFKADTLKRTFYITGFAHLCVPNFWTLCPKAAARCAVFHTSTAYAERKVLAPKYEKAHLVHWTKSESTLIC